MQESMRQKIKVLLIEGTGNHQPVDFAQDF